MIIARKFNPPAHLWILIISLDFENYLEPPRIRLDPPWITKMPKLAYICFSIFRSAAITTSLQQKLSN
jgi:hypothetical protein